VPTPVQIWMPSIDQNPVDGTYSRDLQRAYEARQNEDEIWLLPNAPDSEQSVRWYIDYGGLRVQNCMLRSERFNRLIVFHVDEGRRLYPPTLIDLEPGNTLPEGLYRQWLNSSPDMVEGRLEFEWSVPYIDGEYIRYADATVIPEPGPIMPIREIEARSHTILLTWPSAGLSLPSSVSPETESRDHYGQLQHATIETAQGPLDYVLTENVPEMRALPSRLRWEEPFASMFPTGGSIDLMHHHRRMRKCVEELTAGQFERACRTVEVWVNRLSGEVDASLDHAWFRPKLMTDAEMALFEVEARFGIACATVEELLSRKKFRQLLREQTKVRRVQGWLGYFWWEFYQDITTRVSVRLCNACGSVIRRGHGDRQFCTRDENPACFRARNNIAQKRGREARKNRASRKHDVV
jgi:hypothetical protein